MKVRKAISSIAYLYIDGFRQMTWGKTLWAVILIKLLIIFAVLKIFFFPDYIATRRGTMKAGDFVGSQVLREAQMPSAGDGVQPALKDK